MRVNGIIYDFMGISVKVNGIIFNDFDSINYGSSKEVEVSTNMQGRINGWGRREYIAKGSLSIAFYDYLKLKKAMTESGTLPFYSNNTYIMEVNYGNTGQEMVSDVFEVVFTSEENNNNKGNSKKVINMNFQIVSPRGIKTIYEDGTEVYGTDDLRKII